MKLSFRWYGPEKDPIPLEYIKQIPNVYSIVTQCYEYKPGEVWQIENILNLKKQIEEKKLRMDVIESVPVHEDIKLGRDSRDKYIENYCATIKNLAKAGVKVVCYNFMPAFDWVRTELYKKMNDGSFCESYDQDEIDSMDAFSAIKRFKELPAWTLSFPEEEMESVVKEYQQMPEENLWKNLEYFLKKVIPVCEEVNIKMAIHPDDPAWPIYGIPRIMTCFESLERILKMVDSKSNGLTLCVGSLSTNRKNNLVEIIKKFSSRIYFTHIRNVKFYSEKSFDEIAHAEKNGALDLPDIVKTYYEQNYEGYARPDHGRMIWGEEQKPKNPGYGLYDRALGLSYINGLWDAYSKK